MLSRPAPAAPAWLARARARLRRGAGVVLHLLVLLTWLTGTVATQVHGLAVAHVVCEDHDAVHELGPSADSRPSLAGVDQLRADSLDSDGHDHACGLTGVTVPAAPGETPQGFDAPAACHTRPVLVRATPARGPPLVYAPKTSPPPSC